VPQVGSYNTPRGPVVHAGGSSPVPGSSSGAPSGYRSRTPGKRPAPSEATSARDPALVRPGTSQGLVAPTRPSGSSTARSQHANDARRRHYAVSSDSAPSSARGPRPGSGAGALAGSIGGSNVAAAAAAAVAADLYGNVQGGNASGSSSARAPVTGGRSTAWAPSGRVPMLGAGSARASSASPELGSGSVHETALAAGIGAPPLSARESRDEAMRTCRGAFNVSCTSSKAPKQIMQELHRALALHRVTYKQISAFLVKCQKQSLRFEMEISHLDHLESIYVVRFRRAAGEMAAYKELCSKVLAEMKI